MEIGRGKVSGDRERKGEWREAGEGHGGEWGLTSKGWETMDKYMDEEGWSPCDGCATKRRGEKLNKKKNKFREEGRKEVWTRALKE